MKITLDSENITDQDMDILEHILGYRPGAPNVGAAAQFLAPHDNPAQGVANTAHLTNGAGMVPAQPVFDAAAIATAFGQGGNPLAGVPSIAGAGQSMTAGFTGNPVGNGMQMPAQAFNPQAGALAVPGQQVAAIPSNLALVGTAPVLRDAAGLPWDARIHSSSKEMNKDGTWRGKRNTDKNLIAAVESELRGAMAGAPVQQQVQAVPQQATQMPVANLGVQQFNQQMQPQGIDFATLSMEVANLQTAGKLNMPELFEIVGLFNLSAFHLLQQRPDLVPAVWQQVQIRTAGR